MNGWPRSEARALSSKIPASQEGVIYFITLQVISSMHMLYCGKEKTFGEDHSTFAAKQT